MSQIAFEESAIAVSALLPFLLVTFFGDRLGVRNDATYFRAMICGILGVAMIGRVAEYFVYGC